MWFVKYCLISIIVSLILDFVFADGPDNQYLPPKKGGRGGGHDDDQGEPAKYEFEYAVLDEPSGNDFGHKEMRDGDVAQGTYYVVLPDGRKQTVEYIADNDGYKPKITYEDGFPTHQGSSAGSQGYKY